MLANGKAVEWGEHKSYPGVLVVFVVMQLASGLHQRDFRGGVETLHATEPPRCFFRDGSDGFRLTEE